MPDRDGYSLPPCGLSDTSSLLPPDVRPCCGLPSRHDGPCDWHPLFPIRERVEGWEAQRVFDKIVATGRVDAEVAAAAVAWIKSGELCRHYGPALIIAYSIASAIDAGAVVLPADKRPGGE